MNKYVVSLRQIDRRYRIDILKNIASVTVKDVDDSTVMLTCENRDVDKVEYELRKAMRNDGYTNFKKVYNGI